jgi:hypothetical protein
MGLFRLRVLGLSCSLSFAAVLLPAVAGAQSAQPPAPAPAPAAAPAATYPPVPGAAPPPAAAPAALPPTIYYVQQAPPPPTTYDSRPRRLPFREGDTVPAGYVVDTRTRKGLWIPGVIMVGAPWALGLTIASAANFENASSWLAVPVIGPWIMLAARDKSCDSELGGDCDSASDAAVRTYLVLDGLLQGTGAVMTFVGFTATKNELVRTDYLSLTVLPGHVGTYGYGANAVGTF